MCLALLVAAACAGAYAGAVIGGDGSRGACLAPAALLASRLPFSASVQDDVDALREEVTSGALSGFSKDLVEQALGLADIDSASAAVRPSLSSGCSFPFASRHSAAVARP